MAVTVTQTGAVVSARQEAWKADAASASAIAAAVSESAVVEAAQATWAVGAEAAQTSVSVVSGATSAPVYRGSYEVTPTSGEQVLPTHDRTMRDDLTVHAVPYHSASNESGGYTVSILS